MANRVDSKDNPGRSSPREPALEMYLDSLKPATRQRMVGALRRAAKVLGVEYETYPWHKITDRQSKYVRSSLLEDGAAPATINVVLSALRGVVRAAFGPDPTTLRWEDEKNLDIVRGVRNLSLKGKEAPGRALNEELEALLMICVRDHTTIGLRDTAIVFSLLTGGLSGWELVNLRPAHFQFDPPAMAVSNNAEERMVQLGERAADAVAGRAAVRGSSPGYLFVPLGSETLVGSGMTERNVSQVLSRRSRQADLRPITVHDLRHTAINRLFQSGTSYPSIRRIVGPKHFDTLARHDPREPSSPLLFLSPLPLNLP